MSRFGVALPKAARASGVLGHTPAPDRSVKWFKVGPRPVPPIPPGIVIGPGRPDITTLCTTCGVGLWHEYGSSETPFLGIRCDTCGFTRHRMHGEGEG